jgi:hypothetical protein
MPGTLPLLRRALIGIALVSCSRQRSSITSDGDAAPLRERVPPAADAASVDDVPGDLRAELERVRKGDWDAICRAWMCTQSGLAFEIALTGSLGELRGERVTVCHEGVCRSTLLEPVVEELESGRPSPAHSNSDVAIWESRHGCTGCLRCLSVSAPRPASGWRNGDSYQVTIESLDGTTRVKSESYVLRLPRYPDFSTCSECSIRMKSEECAAARYPEGPRH